MRSRLMALGIAACVVGTAAILWLVDSVRLDRLVPPGEELAYDDFALSIAGVREAAEIGEGESRVQPGGVFLVVRLRVANHAARAPFRMDRPGAVLCDASGEEYPVADAAQAILEREPPRVEIAPGETCERQLVFDVPREARGLALRITWSGPVIDVLEFALSGDRLILPAR